MKKILTITLLMILAMSIVGCGTKNRFTTDDFESALSMEFELDRFDVHEQDNTFSFEAAIDGELTITGTADKNQLIDYIRFENTGLDTSVFDNSTVFSEWWDDAMNSDYYNMTLVEIDQQIATFHCIGELEAFYDVAADEGSGRVEFALNTLLNKESSDIKNWEVKVIVNDEQSLTIEATYIK